MFLSFNAHTHYITAACFLVAREPDGCVMFWGLCFLGEWDTAWNSCLQRSTLPASFVGLGCLPFFFSVCLTVCFYAAVVILHPVSRSHNNSKKKKKVLSTFCKPATCYDLQYHQLSGFCLVSKGNSNGSEPAWYSVLSEYECIWAFLTQCT